MSNKTTNAVTRTDKRQKITADYADYADYDQALFPRSPPSQKNTRNPRFQIFSFGATETIEHSEIWCCDARRSWPEGAIVNRKS